MPAAIRSANTRPSYAPLRYREGDTSSFVPLLPSWLRRREDYVQLLTPLQQVLDKKRSVSMLGSTSLSARIPGKAQKSQKKRRTS